MTRDNPETNLIKLLATPVLACALVGCGGSTETVDLAGKVTIGGQPIPDDARAIITFAPTDPEAGKPVAAPITDGTYEISGVPAGDVRVLFEISRPVGPVKVSERTGNQYQEEESLVPPRFATGVPLTIEQDNASQDFDL